MRRSTSFVIAAALLLPVTGHAVAPALLFMFKQMAQQAATSMLKDALLSSVSGMGCKGIALSNAIAAFEVRKGGGGVSATLGALGIGGGAMPPLAAMPPMPAGLSMPGLPGGMGPGQPASPDLNAALMARMPGAGQLPGGIGLDPEQAAMMARMQQAMSQPLSPAETVAAIDELAELGFVPRAIQGDLKECMVLVPASAQALGMGMGMMKPMIPQLRQARAQLRALTPQEQDEVAEAMAQEVRPLPADQRAAFVEHVDSGFFPPRLAAAIKRRVAR